MRSTQVETPYGFPPVDFLRTRDEERALARAVVRAAEPVFAKVWDNDGDAAYDKL